MENRINLYKTPQGQSQYMHAYDAALRLWPVPFESRYVNTHYGLTHILSCGPEDGFPVVLLHGGYASSTMWFPNVASLSQKYHVLALDTIGEPGKSVPTVTNATQSDCASWLVTVFDELGISSAHVIGLSRGGWLALNLALHALHRLERIVLLSPAASFISLNSFFRAVAGAAMRLPARIVLKAALYSWVAPGFVINEVFAEQFILGLRNWNWAMGTSGYSGVMPSAFRDEDLRQIQNPVLMLIGDHDRLNPPEVILRARHVIPHIEAEIIPKAGHLLSMEQPERVDELVIKFLSTHP